MFSSVSKLIVPCCAMLVAAVSAVLAAESAITGRGSIAGTCGNFNISSLPGVNVSLEARCDDAQFYSVIDLDPCIANDNGALVIASKIIAAKGPIEPTLGVGNFSRSCVNMTIDSEAILHATCASLVLKWVPAQIALDDILLSQGGELSCNYDGCPVGASNCTHQPLAAVMCGLFAIVACVTTTSKPPVPDPSPSPEPRPPEVLVPGNRLSTSCNRLYLVTDIFPEDVFLKANCMFPGGFEMDTAINLNHCLGFDGWGIVGGEDGDIGHGCSDLWLQIPSTLHAWCLDEFKAETDLEDILDVENGELACNRYVGCPVNERGCANITKQPSVPAPLDTLPRLR
ncbi:hypothetical protein GGR56DRAFT_688158 [Xylariaceae sp. FL0804]|nr:hypothetical protein GGR56DRAFT_688158 [Xylariaceae sp. FL0804]